MTVKSEKYWADLLEQYKLGSISESDRFELEKRALDDPFLFDALEGYSLISKETESEKKEKTRIFSISRMAAAASLIFLVTLTFLLRNNDPKEISDDQSIAMVLDESQDESKAKNEEKTTLNYDKTQQQKVAVDTQIIKEESEESQSPPSKQSNNQGSPVKKIKATPEEDIDIKEVNTETKTLDPRTDNYKSTEITPNPNSKESESTEYIASDNEDVVNIPKEARTLDKKTQSSQLDLDSSEYEETVDNNPSPSSAMAKKTKKSEAPSTFYVVEPAIGKKDFEEFVRESIDLRGLRQPSPHEVTIEFDIDKSGTLSNFLHIYNGCSECGGYAIYLLSTSGVWKTTPEGMEGRARYKLTF